MNEHLITIGLIGDLMLGRGVSEAIRTNGYSYPWGNTLSLFHGTDLNIMNLENAFTESQKTLPKTFHFKAPPDQVKTVLAAGVPVLNLANNHVLDYTEKGLMDTLQTLRQAGIPFTGAGENLSVAQLPVIVSRKGLPVGILGFTDNEAGWKAGPGRAGTNYIDITETHDRKLAVAAVRELAPKTGLAIVSLHWGPNMNRAPSRSFVSFAHELVEAGADIIHGHSAHNFQGIEVYRGKLILYDTGDFIDDYMVHEEFRNDLSFFFRVSAGQHEIRNLEMIPVFIRNCQVNVAGQQDAAWCFERMKELSAAFGTSFRPDGQLIIH